MPTNVSKPQSPFNFILAAMYEGPGTRSLVEKFTGLLFKFANGIAENRGVYVFNGDQQVFVHVDVLFVSDLKMLSIVLGIKAPSANQFCPFYLVQRDDHKARRCRGTLKMFNQKALLQIPYSNIVVPPLHVQQSTSSNGRR